MALASQAYNDYSLAAALFPTHDYSTAIHLWPLVDNKGVAVPASSR